ncbi:hypothetical protein UPYG_G00138920 [Umbra pygmaea]|uniref:Gastric inhibitory polypeptide n=1 Tax=Umbra pygmaea TaxID=75934 RepID=A0ABD0XFK4_UMBPY
MKIALFALVVLWLSGMLNAEALGQSAEESHSDNGEGLERRYAESTIASDMSKIMDSMVQKNFVNFLLKQREKKSVSYVTPVEDPEVQFYNGLLKKRLLCICSKGDK